MNMFAGYVQMNPKLARILAAKAGNDNMRAAGRTTWSRVDYNVAAEEMERLWPSPEQLAVAEKYNGLRLVK